MANWHLIFFNLSITFYSFSTLIYIYNFTRKEKVFKYNLEYFFIVAAFIFQLVFIIIRWMINGHAPMTTMFEYLNIFSFFIVVSYLLMYKLFKVNIIGFIVNILILVIMIISSLYSKEITPLVPALNSYWLSLHVSLAALGEGLFVISFVASYLYLIKRSTDNLFSQIILEFLLFLAINIFNIAIARLLTADAFIYFSFVGMTIYLLVIIRTKRLVTSILEKKLRFLNSAILDQLSYQSIAFGYPIFTLGALVFAMIWAEEAWGSYWSWDPKETWALISWLFYGLYLHLRLLKGWREKRTAWISVVGFVILLFTLFGVTYLLPGNHAYI